MCYHFFHKTQTQISSLTETRPDLLSQMGGDPSPRGTESEKRLRLAPDEGEQHGCLEVRKEKMSTSYLSHYHPWLRTIHGADSPHKSQKFLTAAHN